MPQRTVPMESKGPLALQRFMEIMRKDTTRDLVRKINKFTQEMEAIKKPGPEKDSLLVQNFLQKMENEVHRHRVWPTLSAGDQQILIEGVETYVLTKLYRRLFGRYEEDIERDNLLSSRLYALQFVSPSHLDIAPDIISNETLVSAIRELQKMNSYKAPRDKLSCILDCCQAIQHLLHSTGHETGADSFMPVLNYVVIKAQPPHLISNIEYIRRFRMKSKLVSYADYYFTQFSGSAFFIESADAGSFTGGRQEFLSSFLQQGLISWQQYEDALQEGGEREENQQTIVFSTKDNSETSLFDEDVGAASSMGDLKSLKDDVSTFTRSIDWSRLRDMDQLIKDGYPLVTQLAASGDLIARNPMLSVHCRDLTVAQIEKLLEEYKNLALNHEVLLEAAKQQDTPSVLGNISDFETRLHWRSIKPAEGHLLMKYPFLCSSFHGLTFRDIARLLDCYKTLVLESEALVAGLKRRIIPESSTGRSPSTLDFPSLEEYQEQCFKDPQESEAPLITRLSGPPVKSSSLGTVGSFTFNLGHTTTANTLKTSTSVPLQTQISRQKRIDGTQDANEKLESNVLFSRTSMPEIMNGKPTEESLGREVMQVNGIDQKIQQEDIHVANVSDQETAENGISEKGQKAVKIDLQIVDREDESIRVNFGFADL